MVGPNTEISMFTFLPLQGSVSSLSLVHQGAETGHVFTFFRVIMETPAHENAFLENLQNLEHKINFLKEQSFRGSTFLKPSY